MAISKEAERIFKELEAIKNDYRSLKDRSEKGYVFEQNVSDKEFIEMINRLDALQKDAFEFLDSRMEEYKRMENDIALLKEKLNLAFEAKGYISSK